MKKLLLIASAIVVSAIGVNAQNRVGNFHGETKSFNSVAFPAKASMMCDTTTNFPSTGTPTLYTSTNGGYVVGHNGYGDIAKADKYAAPATSGSSIVGVLYAFGTASAASGTSSFNATIYGVDAAGAPGTTLSTSSVLYADAATDVTNGALTFVDLSTAPVAVSTDYFVGMEFTYAAGDTIALITCADGEAAANTAWEQFDTGTWYAFDDPSSWGLSLNMAVFPILCDATGINQPVQDGIVIYPNPTSGQVIIHNTNNGHDAAIVTVSNSMGQIVMNSNIADFAGTHRFDLSSFSNGIYTVAVNAGNSNMTYRLVLNK